MAKYSYQDMFVRLAALEDKIDFVMKAFTVQKLEGSIVGHQVPVTYSLLDIYHLQRAAGVLAEAIVLKGQTPHAGTEAVGSGLVDQGLAAPEEAKV